MIDICNELYTLLVNALASYDTNIKTSSVYTNTPSSYPFVSFEEIDNSEYLLTKDLCGNENHAQVDYEINIWTKSPNKKSKGDKILQVVDTLMKRYNFDRMTKNNFQSSDETTYRIVIRYSGIVSKEHKVY